MGDTTAFAELREHHAYVAGDHPFKRDARLQQSVWRERRGFPIGMHRGEPLGSRLKMPEAAGALWNFLSPVIGQRVRTALTQSKKLIQQPRIFEDLLSSQPLCFNLFGELQVDLDLGTRVLRHLMPGPFQRVTRIEFEYSPGRSDPRYTADLSAFDVYLEYTDSAGSPGFVGIEVKYVEDMGDKPARHRARYDEIAATMGCFHPQRQPSLQGKPLNQLWRNHLLVGSMLHERLSSWTHGHFVLLYPEANTRVTSAMQAYTECLVDRATFATWTLERFIETIDRECDAAWVSDLKMRYCNGMQARAL